MILVVAVSLLAGCWAGLGLATWIGASAWARVGVVVLWILAGALLVIALSAHAGNCAGDDHGVIHDVIPESRVFVQFGAAWASAFVIAISSAFSARVLTGRDWLGFWCGLLIASVCCAIAVAVFDPLFEHCVPTPIT